MIIKILGFGGRRRLPAGQLQLPQLRRRAPWRARPAAAHAVLAGREPRRPVWVLLNASPDIRQQIAATPELAPAASGGSRDQSDQGRGADQRRCRPCRRAAQPARGHSLHSLRLGPRASRALAANPRLQRARRSPRRPQARWPLDAHGAACRRIDGRGVSRCPARSRSIWRTRPTADARRAGGRHARPQDHRSAQRRLVLLHPGVRRHGRRPSPPGCAARNWSCSTARSTLTTR